MNDEDAIREIHERYLRSGPSLNELQRRLWAATEAMKLGRGGVTLVSKALRISPNTIKRGVQEITTGEADSLSNTNTRIRKSGGGRKSKKTSSDQLTRTRSNKDSAGIEPESGVSDRSDETRREKLPIPTDEVSLPVDDT